MIRQESQDEGNRIMVMNTGDGDMVSARNS